MSRPIHNKNTCWVVKNLKGTSGLKCKCGSWLKHWKKGALSQRATCAVLGCGLNGEVGAHIKSTDKRTDVKWWIAPFCKKHNHYMNEEFMHLDTRLILISANTRKTCENSNWAY